MDRVFHDSSLFPGDLFFPASHGELADFFFDAGLDWVSEAAAARFVPHPMQSTFAGELVTPHEGQTTFPVGRFFSSAALASSFHTSAIPHLAQNLSLRATGDPQLLHEIDGLTATIVPSQ
jgi:hypothetical protein